MKEFILKRLLEWAAGYLTKDQIDQWEKDFMGQALPKLYAAKDELVNGLREKAAATENQIDDKCVDAADEFLTGMLDRLKA